MAEYPAKSVSGTTLIPRDYLIKNIKIVLRHYLIKDIKIVLRHVRVDVAVEVPEVLNQMVVGWVGLDIDRLGHGQGQGQGQYNEGLGRILSCR